MTRFENQDLLVREYLYQTMGLNGRDSPNYKRVMNHFDSKDDLTIRNLLRYIKKHPMRRGASLTDLYNCEAYHRQEEHARHEKSLMPRFADNAPYSIEMVLNLKE